MMSLTDANLSRVEYENGEVPIRRSGWVPARMPESLPPLAADLQASVAVIGAGLAGTSLALHLAERGVDVVLLEARQPGDGASGRNAGHVQPYLVTLDPTKDWPDQGKRLLDLVTAERDIVFDLAAKHGISCDAARTGMIEAAIRRYGELEEKARTWKGHGYDVEVVGKADLTSMLGTTRYSYGVHWRDGGRVNPYLLTQGLAGAAAKNGARVFGDSPVIACDREGARWRVRTRQASVLAERVVVCTNGHLGNQFFPNLAKTNFPLVAYAVATKPLPPDVLAAVNPSRAALTQFPVGLTPMLIDERDRIITASIPSPWRAENADRHFRYALRYLHQTFPITRDADIQLESYWTGMTANSSSVYHADYPRLYRVDDGVLGLMNLGTWGVFLGPLLGKNLAQALADDRLGDAVLPLSEPTSVPLRSRFALKIRYGMIPAGRLVDRLDVL